MHQHPITPHRGQQPNLRGADDRARTDRDITGLHVITGAPHIVTRTHRAQHLDPRLTTLGPAQRQHRIGQCRHRSTGLHPHGLPGLQPSGGALAYPHRPDHRQFDRSDLAAGFFEVVFVLRGATFTRADHAHHATGGLHINAAHGVSIDGGLIKPG